MAHRSIPPFELHPDPGPDRWPASGLGRLRDRRALALVAALLVAAGVGWWLLRPAPAPVDGALPMASGSATTSAVVDPAAGDAAPGAIESTTTTAPPLVVQAAGAVRAPGLYRLDAGARVDDLIRAAGGLTERADRERINLAAPLADGQRVWLPIIGRDEAPPVATGPVTTAAPSGSSGSSGSSGAEVADAGPVDLNAADAEQLDALPGVGPATAAAILAHREEAGPFQSVDELLDVPGIGDAKLEQLRPLVTVG